MIIQIKFATQKEQCYRNENKDFIDKDTKTKDDMSFSNELILTTAMDVVLKNQNNCLIIQLSFSKCFVYKDSPLVHFQGFCERKLDHECDSTSGQTTCRRQ